MENGRSEDDEISRWVWKAVKNKTNKARMAKTEGKGMKEEENAKKEEKRV